MLVLAAACSYGSPTSSPTPTSPAGCEKETMNTIRAVSLSFDRDCLAVPAEVTSTLTFANDDAGESHNVAIYPEDSCLAKAVTAGREPRCRQATEAAVFRGSVVIGVERITYHVPALTSGRYVFACEVHLSMHGALRVA
jgi:plastocyanin